MRIWQFSSRPFFESGQGLLRSSVSFEFFFFVFLAFQPVRIRFHVLLQAPASIFLSFCIRVLDQALLCFAFLFFDL